MDSFVAFACGIGFLSACGGTARSDGNSQASDTGVTTTSAVSHTSGSGGSTTQGVTAAASNSSATGTGGTTMTDCPSFEPAVGSTCTEEDQVCAFENCLPPAFNDNHVLTCSEGAWTVTDVTVCELKACPDSLPVVGGFCDASIAPGPCGFVDGCGTYVEVECVAGTWQAVDANDREAPADPAPPEPVCPAYPPHLGDQCCPTTVPEVCDYSASSSGTAGAAGASFLIDPTGSTSSGGGGGMEPPPTLLCAVCTPQMRWDYCPE